MVGPLDLDLEYYSLNTIRANRLNTHKLYAKVFLERERTKVDQLLKSNLVLFWRLNRCDQNILKIIR